MKSLSLHLLDILQNSIVVDSTKIQIDIEDSKQRNVYQISIADNGKGMSEEMLKTVIDPYTTSRTTRKVGLGIPLFKMNAENTGGWLSIHSELGKGTTITACFVADHIDCPEPGDIAGTIVLTAATNETIHFVYTHKTDNGKYVFDTEEVKEILDGGPINDVQIIRYLREMIEENLEEIGAWK